jgi:hypothetical protein
MHQTFEVRWHTADAAGRATVRDGGEIADFVARAVPLHIRV